MGNQPLTTGTRKVKKLFRLLWITWTESGPAHEDAKKD